MSTILDDYESEAYDDGEGEGEDYPEADYEGEDFESARSEAAVRARARRIALARSRRPSARMRRRARTTAVPAAGPQQTAAAVRTLDLESDSLRRAIERSNQLATRATYSAVAGAAINQALDTFETSLAGHSFVRAGMRFAPLLLLSPQRRRGGLEGIALHPAVMGAVGLGGVVAAGEFRNRDSDVTSIDVLPPEINALTPPGQLLGVAVNRKGGDVGDPIVWKSSNDAVLHVEPDGAFDVRSEGSVRLTATAGGFVKSLFVDVKPAPDIT